VRKNRAAPFGMTGGEVAEKANKRAAGRFLTGRERWAEAGGYISELAGFRRCPTVPAHGLLVAEGLGWGDA
jgi:hypothetical protein